MTVMPNTLTLLFAHGWGFDAGMWDDVIAHLNLPENTVIRRIDLGYTGNPVTPIPVNADSNNTICIGHSLGAALLLQNIRNPAGMIAINGFDHFCGHIPASDIDAMQNNLRRNMTLQMQGFYRACGVTINPLPSFNRDTLLTGLNTLKTLNVHKALKTLECPVTALLSRNDKVFPYRYGRDIWKNTDMVTHANGGHCLPLTDPAFCAAHIANHIEKHAS